MKQRLVRSRMVQRLLRRRSWLAKPPGMQAWRPLFLRWARRATPAVRAVALRAPALPATQVHNRVHWHWHFTVLAGATHACDDTHGPALTGAHPHPVPNLPAHSARLAWRHILPAGANKARGAGPGLARAAGSVLQQFITQMPAPGTGSLAAPSMPVRDRAPMLLRPAGAARAALPIQRARARSAARGASVALAAVPARQAVGGQPPTGRQQPGPPARTFAWTGRTRPAQHAAAAVRLSAPAGPRPAARAWRITHAAASAVAPSMPRALRSVPPSMRWQAAPAPAPGVVMARTLDLAWRTVSAGTPGSAGAAGARLAPGAPVHTAAGVAAPLPAPAPARSNATGAVPATALDPALASRLADEVMRRIDLRARIARERLGL